MSNPGDAQLLAENAELREMIKTLQAQIEEIKAHNDLLKEQIEELKQHNHVLRLKVDAMARKLFGKSSEKLDPAQLQMVFAALQKETAGDDAAKKATASDSPACGSEAESVPASAAGNGRKKKRSLDELIEGLPVSEVIIDPHEVKADPEAWTCIGAEVTKLIDYIPGKFQCEKLIRRKYVRKDARHLPPITAPLHTLQDRCIATPRLLAHTASSHFELHLPYYRIEQMHARLGVPIPRQTLCGWMGMTHEACSLIIEQIKRDVFADGYVQADETPVKYQDPERKGVCGTGYLWVFHNPVRNVSLFAWRTGRGAACLENIVPPDFQGIIQCDGYSAYEAFIKTPARAGRIELAGCMAHARRKFFEAKAEGEDPQWVLAQVQQLYRIEARLREARAGPEEVLSTRQQHSAPIMAAIKARLEQLQASHKHRPRSLTGEAISYALNQWPKLCVFLGDGREQIDNNLVENTIRPSAIGKKNWLFMGDAQSGARAATFYTLISNCHRQGIDATAYLTDIFKRLPTETNQTIHRLTPKAWAADQAAKRHSLAQTAIVQM
jgi:transposase/regulator of replication initiation timing